MAGAAGCDSSVHSKEGSGSLMAMTEEDPTVARIKRDLLTSIATHIASLTPPAPPVKKDSDYWRDVWLMSLALVTGVLGMAALIVGVLFALDLRK